MSIGFSIAINAVPFFDLLGQEVEATANGVLEATDERAASIVMDASRRRLAQGVDTFVRGLPAVVRNDTNISRSAAYTLVGLADERMLHYAAGGLERWRERLLEFELYGSALAGQEIVRQARASAQSTAAAEVGEQLDTSLLAPLHLAVLREGFEGSLRGDAVGLSTLTATLEEAVGAVRSAPVDIASDAGPSRFGFAPMPLAVFGFALWLMSGFVLWLTLPGDALSDADRIAQRIEAGLPITPGAFEPGQRTIGPSGLPALEDVDGPTSGGRSGNP